MTLLVVDMQSSFKAARNKRIQNNCLKLIKKATYNREPIIFLEYVNHSKTIPKLRGAAMTYYNKSFFISKNKNSGAYQVHKIIKAFRFSKNITVCGVNTDYCVSATIIDLLKYKYKITLVENACNSNTNRKQAFNYIKENIKSKNFKLK